MTEADERPTNLDLARRIALVEQAVEAVKGEIGDLKVGLATSAADVRHMRQSLDSVLTSVRWIVLLVLAAVVGAVLNLVLKGQA